MGKAEGILMVHGSWFMIYNWFMATYGSRLKVNGYDARTKVAN